MSLNGLSPLSRRRLICSDGCEGKQAHVNRWMRVARVLTKRASKPLTTTARRMDGLFSDCRDGIVVAIASLYEATVSQSSQRRIQSERVRVCLLACFWAAEMMRGAIESLFFGFWCRSLQRLAPGVVLSLSLSLCACKTNHSNS